MSDSTGEFLRKLVERLDRAIEAGGPHAKADVIILALREELDDWRRREEIREAIDDEE